MSAPDVELGLEPPAPLTTVELPEPKSLDVDSGLDKELASELMETGRDVFAVLSFSLFLGGDSVSEGDRRFSNDR